VENLEQASCIVAREVDGRPTVLELDGKVAQSSGGISTTWFWTTDGAPALPDGIGVQPAGPTFPGPGGSKFGLVSLPAHHVTGMHATASVDFEIVVSGRIVLELPEGEPRVLGPGDSVVLAGVAHRWRNPFDEACVYAAFIVGADPS
jgi:quercetin dioxygenase-like cupin family protein